MDSYYMDAAERHMRVPLKTEIEAAITRLDDRLLQEVTLGHYSKASALCRELAEQYETYAQYLRVTEEK